MVRFALIALGIFHLIAMFNPNFAYAQPVLAVQANTRVISKSNNDVVVAIRDKLKIGEHIIFTINKIDSNSITADIESSTSSTRVWLVGGDRGTKIEKIARKIGGFYFIAVDLFNEKNAFITIVKIEGAHAFLNVEVNINPDDKLKRKKKEK